MRFDPINLHGYEARAKQVLPHTIWDFVEGGAMDEVTTRRNRSAFQELSLRPRFLRDISQRDISTTVLGEPISLPVMICPAGGHMSAHPEGEVATAKGAGMSGTLMMLSTSSNCSMEEVAEATTGPLWYQLDHHGYEYSEMLVRRAEEAGFKAISLGADIPLPSPKERDIRNRYTRPFPLGNFRSRSTPLTEASGIDEGLVWDRALVPPLTWKGLEWLRSITSLPLVLKGIRTAEDAHLAVEHGVDGIQVSTHGGRQLDMTMSSCRISTRGYGCCKGSSRGLHGFGSTPGQRRGQSLGFGRPGRGHWPPFVLGLGGWRR